MTFQFSHHFSSHIPENYVWVIGNFDGLHKGHIALIKAAQLIAKNLNLKTGLLSFYPHPRMYFNSNQNPINIMQQSEKIQILKDLQIHHYYLHPFNQKVATMSALDFCLKLKNQLKPRHLIIGHDFHFGQNRSGTPEFLKNFCTQNHIDCTIINPELSDNGVRYSSEAIRVFLQQGDIESVKSFLKFDYIITGRVQHGKKLARQLGFPTANIIPNNLFLPKYGVYQCRVINMNNQIAIANIGKKPTLNENHLPILEVHILNFNRDLYGHKLRIAFDKFIRPEKKFSSLDELKTQINKDLKQIAI